MFIINPDQFLLPAYRISPFRTSDISINTKLSNSNTVDDYFRERFPEREIIYTTNGRKALNLALDYYKLKSEDLVTILTTSDSFYISSCVTQEIEKFCGWSREISDQTKVILVNHEFGYPFPELQNLLHLGIPIIEDCAHSFFSKDLENKIGTIGDFVIYSFPKMFPMQIGGLLISNMSKIKRSNYQIERENLRYIKNSLSEYIKYEKDIINKRIKNYTILRSKFESLGLVERFQLLDGIVPGVFMFRTKNYEINLPELKKYFWSHGIQSSVFYGEDSFFIPVHQALNEIDLDYFYEVMKSFIQGISK